MNPPRSSTTAGTAVARIVASIATSPMLSMTARRIGPRSLRRPTLARVISGALTRDPTDARHPVFPAVDVARTQ